MARPNLAEVTTTIFNNLLWLIARFEDGQIMRGHYSETQKDFVWDNVNLPRPADNPSWPPVDPGSGEIPPEALVPTALVYDAIGPVNIGDTITEPLPVCTGSLDVTDTVTAYTSLDLPEGLTLNEETGAIAGAPTEWIPNGVFHVTATSPAGSITADVHIDVRETALFLTYPTAGEGTATAHDGDTISMQAGGEPLTVTPNVQGAATVVPDFPTGITLDPLTGIIAGGTSSTPIGAHTYVLTVGAVSMEITIDVVPAT